MLKFITAIVAAVVVVALSAWMNASVVIFTILAVIAWLLWIAAFSKKD